MAEVPEKKAAEQATVAFPSEADAFVEKGTAAGGGTVHDPNKSTTPAAEKDPEAKKTIGAYEVVKEIGRGGMGVVYMALQTALKRLVALKVISAGPKDDILRTRFRIEAEAVAQLQHPHIIQVHEVGEHEGQPFLALEYVGGGCLDDLLEGIPWSAQDAARLVRLLAQAMEHAHRRGIIHRDLKPANVLLSWNREVTFGDPSKSRRHDVQPKITDFGLAKRMDDAQGPSQSGSILGTPSYMSPEQADGRVHETGPATDIYSLGAILYELVTGRPPFCAATVLDTVVQVMRDDPLPPRMINPMVPRDLETICLKCLEKSPHRRYASALALAEDLERFEKGEAPLARPIGRLEKGIRWCRRNPARAWAAGIMLGCVLLLLGFAGWFHARMAEQLELTEKAHAKVQTALTQQGAQRIDGDLRQLASIPRLVAETLGERSDWTEPQLEAWLRAILAGEPRVFGMCVAFEPRQFDHEREDFALYVHRIPGGIAAKQLDPATYKPIYREWAWYREPLRRGKAVWSEPYVDTGGGEVPMITYSLPLYRKGRYLGVVTADLSMDYFRFLADWLQKLHLPEEDYAFVLSPTGTFIGHPRWQLPTRIQDIPDYREEAMKNLVQRMLAGESGRAIGPDPISGKQAVYLYAPIPSAGWTLVVVAPTLYGE